MTSAPTSTASPSDVLRDYVGRRAAQLYEGYQRDDAGAVATLARLRRTFPSGRGLRADTWDVFDGMPAALLGHEDTPSRTEYAAVVALALFAVHQQSRRDEAMHRSGAAHSWGRSIARLSVVDGGEGVNRRFRALTRSSDIVAALPHLRGLVTQLRNQRIATDYGALATDLYRLQWPADLHTVRMRWTRDFHRPTTTDATTDATTATDPSGADQ